MSYVIAAVIIGFIVLWQWNKRRVARNLRAAIVGATHGLKIQVESARDALGSQFDRLVTEPEMIGYLMGFTIAICNFHQVTVNQDLVVFSTIREVFPDLDMEVISAFRQMASDMPTVKNYQDIIKEAGEEAFHLIRTGEPPTGYYVNMIALSRM